MRLLHTADWHLGRNLEQYSRLDEQAAFLDEINLICRDQSVDLVLVAGDVFDAYNPSAAAETLFYEALERLADNGSRSVVVIAGNHDNPDRLRAAAPLALKHGIFLLGYPADDADRLHRTEDVGRILRSGAGYLCIRPGRQEQTAALLAVPFPSEARLEALAGPLQGEQDLQEAYSDRIGRLFDRLAAAAFRESTVNCAVTHLFTLGSRSSDSERILQLGTGMMVLPEHLPASAQYIALGHLHRPQAVAACPAPARYAGSPLGYSFSEANSVKSVCLVDVQPGRQADVRTVDLSSGRPLRRWIARDGLSQAMTWAREGRDAGCWIDLDLTVDCLPTAGDLKNLRSLNPGILHIRPILDGPAPDGAPAAGREDRKIEDLFAEYYRFRNGRDVPADVLAAFIELINQPETGEVEP